MAHFLLDTLLLPAAANLVRLYRREGTDKVAALADRLRQALGVPYRKRWIRRSVRSAHPASSNAAPSAQITGQGAERSLHRNSKSGLPARPSLLE